MSGKLPVLVFALVLAGTGCSASAADPRAAPANGRNGSSSTTSELYATAVAIAPVTPPNVPVTPPNVPVTPPNVPVTPPNVLVTTPNVAATTAPVALATLATVPPNPTPMPDTTTSTWRSMARQIVQSDRSGVQDVIDQLASVGRGTTLATTAVQNIEAIASHLEQIADAFRELQAPPTLARVQATCQKALVTAGRGAHLAAREVATARVSSKASIGELQDDDMDICVLQLGLG